MSPPVETDSTPLVEALLRPEAYPTPVAGVELMETHISWLFLTDERVYKVKKPVSLGFLDFSTLELREHFCAEEVRLNRRLAPDIYLGVVPIVEGADGRLHVGGEGRVVDHAVEMVRLPAAGMMGRLLDAGEIDNERLQGLADRLLSFHRDAQAGPAINRQGSFDVIAKNARDNFEQTEPYAGPPEPGGGEYAVSQTLHAFLRERTEELLEAHAELFERRVAEGRIRDGHGDLHAGNICLTPAGPVVYDCLEFSERYRHADVACDLAFLTMDLDLRGYRAFSDHLARYYSEAAGDPELLEILPFYETYRALVRAKVKALRAAEPGADLAAALAQSRRYFQLAGAYHLPPVLILTCGLPASGKSFSAQVLARPFEARIYGSEAALLQVAGGEVRQRRSVGWETGLYGTGQEEEVYRILSRKAARGLREGRSVVVDAAFTRRSWRRAFLDAAIRLGHRVVVVWYDTPPEVILQRLHRRALEAETVPVDREAYRQAVETFEPPYEVDPENLVVTNSVEPPEAVTGRLIDRVIGLG